MKYAKSIPNPDEVVHSLYMEKGWHELKEPSKLALACVASLPFMLICGAINLALLAWLNTELFDFLNADTLNSYFTLTQQYGITPSMSRRGNCLDNAMAENFFSILKTECIYRAKPKTIIQAKQRMDAFTHFYYHDRIQLKTREARLSRRFSY